MSNISVSSSTELKAALKSAHAGDTFQLQSGTYGGIAIHDLNVGGMITITSADPAHQAVLTDLQIDNSSGITVKNLEVFATTNSDKNGVVGVFQVSDVHFDHLNVHGSLDGNTLNDTDGLRIKLSDNVSVTNSEFQQLRVGIGFGDSTNVKLTGNYIHDLSMDGIHGGGTSNMLVANNYITDFSKRPGVHADGIQFYTGNIVKLVHDITVTGNVISQGDGEQIQGIFMRNEEAAGRFNNVTVSENLVLGGNTNGIALGGATNLQVTNNTIVSRSGDLSWLRLEGDDGRIVVTGNSAAKFIFETGSPITESGNLTNIKSTDDGMSALRDWLNGHINLKSLLPSVVSSTVEHAGLVDLSQVVNVVASGSTILGAVGQSLALTGTLNADGLGNALANTLTGNDGNNNLVGLDGSDTLEGGKGDDVLNGGAGNDTASYEHATAGVVLGLSRSNGGSTNGVTQATGGAGKDTLIDIENLTGSAYADTLSGDAAANKLVGGAGDDVLGGDAGNDTIDAGAGADLIQAGDGADSINGGAGADSITGGAGADRIVGGEGADRIILNSADNSTVAVGGRDTILDFQAGDIIDLKKLGSFKLVTQFTKVAGQLTSTLDGDHYVVQGDVNGDGAADFAINVHSSKALVAADFYGVTTGAATIAAPANQAAAATPAPANVVANAVAVVAPAAGVGGAGDDKLMGADGADKLQGLAGNDTLEGGAGDDTLDGGAGSDTASYEHAGAGVTIGLLNWKGASTSGMAQATGGAGKDTLIDIENVSGSAYADTLSGDTNANKLSGAAGDDVLSGDAGADTLDGGAGADWMEGGDGADSLSGGAGADTLIAGAGADRIAGGDGADRFQFSSLDASTVSARDVIVDFQAGDTIDLRKIDAITGGSDEGFKLVSTFTHAAGQLTANLDGDHYVVQGDVNGDGLADFAINVYASKGLVAGDFLL